MYVDVTPNRRMLVIIIIIIFIPELCLWYQDVGLYKSTTSSLRKFFIQRRQRIFLIFFIQ